MGKGSVTEMDWQMLAWSRLADAAAGGLIVLCVGSLAVRLCRQPARRARLVVLAVVGGIAVPLVSALPIAPRWTARSLPVREIEQRTVEHAPAFAVHLGQRPVPDQPRATMGRGGRPVRTDTPRIAATPMGPARATSVSRIGVPSARTVLLACYCALAAGFAAWWLVGQVVLWRVTRAARSVSASVRGVFQGLAGPEGATVVLLESDRIALPFTYTWTRPVILLPSALCEGNDPEALRYALAHEWSHVERRDAWAWNLANLGGLLLFYQPLFWWLRRQLRLSQDYLADARAAAAGSAEDYAAFLVQLARARAADPALAGLGIVDRRSNLSRRVMMLVQDHEPLERRCRAGWSFAAASAAVAVIVVASGFRVTAAPPDTKQSPEVKSTKDAARGPAEPARTEEALHYTGTVVDKDTGKGIAGATVVVRRSLLRADEDKVLQETEHTTGADGTYSFTIPPEQVAEPSLYIELDVEHPDYATRAGFGYALAMTRKNEKLNERPFFERIEMRPAKAVTGRIETPEGKPAAGVAILAYSRVDRVTTVPSDYGSFARTQTDAEGKFRVPITTPGHGVIWILPKSFVPEMHALADGKRGDLGTFTLSAGMTVTGRVFDVQGKPLAGLSVKIDREDEQGKDFQLLDELGVGDAIDRTADTDAEGRFTFDPLPPGNYKVVPIDTAGMGNRSAGWTWRELPGLFAPRKVSIRADEAPAPIELRASPHVVLEGQWVDGKGKPGWGWSSIVFGRIDGSSWFGETHPDRQGRFSLKVPHALEHVELHISTNEHASAEYRIGKDGALQAGRRVKLGTLDHDVRELEIVRYVSPIIVVNATTKDGRQVKDFKVSMEYTGPGTDDGKDIGVVGGGKIKGIQDEQYDGRYRTMSLLPDREVAVTVSAEGFNTASRKVTLPEGKTDEITVVLEPK